MGLGGEIIAQSSVSHLVLGDGVQDVWKLMSDFYVFFVSGRS